jgi:hypothetical protein
VIEKMFQSISPDFWWSLGVATVIAIAATVRLKIWRADECPQMDWMDWCMHCALVGILTIFSTAIIDWEILRAAGVFLLIPLYPIALLGLLCKLDDMLTSFMRGWRKR